MTSQRPPKARKGSNRRIAELEAEVARLRSDLAAAQAPAQPSAQDGPNVPPPPPRLAELEEGRHIARGQALEAAVARSRAEADLRALQDAIGKVPGVYGWLLRRAQRRLRGQ